MAGKPLYSPYFEVDSFSYSPPLAVFFVPFSLLPEVVGSFLWRLLLVAFYLVSLHRWASRCLPAPVDPERRAQVFLLVAPLAGPILLNGQAGILVAGLIHLTFADTADRRWNRAALWAVLAGIIKVYPFAVALLLVVIYPRKLPLRLLLALAICAAVPFLFQDARYVLAQYVDWPRFLSVADRSPWYRGRFNCDLQLLLSTWARPLAPDVYRMLQLTLAAGAAILCRACRRADGDSRTLLLRVQGLGACWMTVFGPAAESFTYVLIGPTLAWLLLESVATARPITWRATLHVSWSLFLISPILMWTSHGAAFRKLGPHPAAGLLVLACLLARILAGLRPRASGEADRPDHPVAAVA
jgi:hypothetical protein